MISEGGVSEQENYMFFGNIEQMGRQCDILMREDKNQIDSIAPKAFYNLEALEYLDLRWNNLQVSINIVSHSNHSLK